MVFRPPPTSHCGRVVRVAHVGPSSLPVWNSRGGAVQRRMIELGRRQVELGDEALLLSASVSGDSIRPGDVNTVSIPCRMDRPWRDFEYLLRVAKVLKSFRPDVVHFHGVPLGAALVRPACPSVLSVDFFRFRGSERTLGHQGYSYCISKYAVICAVSEYCGRHFRSYWPNMPHVRVVPNGVSLEQFRPDRRAGEAMRARLGIAEEVPVALYVGRVCEQKGSDTLASAAPVIKAGVPRIEIVVAGPSGQFGETGRSALVDRLVEAGARYVGAVDERELNAIYNMCDVFLMPTRTDEMFGMAAAEAQACGKPVVCSRQGGLLEAASGRSAVFVPPGDAQALARAVIDLLRDDGRRRELATYAREHVRQFSWPVVTDAYRAVYDATLAPSGVMQSRSLSAKVAPIDFDEP